MATPLKEYFSTGFYDRFTASLADVLPGLDQKKFLSQIYSPAFEGMELKQRMRHTAVVMHNFLPDSYPRSIGVINNSS